MDSEFNNNISGKILTAIDNGDDLSDDYTDADESISAPTEILAEFLSSIMLKEYDKALKYCKLILHYEPNNTTAKEFYPLIEEKLELKLNEEEYDSSSSDSSETSSITSKKSASSSGSNGTTASYSSLEEEEVLFENKTISSGEIYQSANDLTNWNSCNPCTPPSSVKDQAVPILLESKTETLITTSASANLINNNTNSHLSLKNSQTITKLLELKTNPAGIIGNAKHPVPVTECKKKTKSLKSKDTGMGNSSISTDIANGNIKNSTGVIDSKTVENLTKSKLTVKTGLSDPKDITNGNANSFLPVIESNTVPKLVSSGTSTNTKPCIPSLSNLMIHPTPTVTLNEESTKLSRTNTYTKYFSPQTPKKGKNSQVAVTTSKSEENSPKSFWEKLYPSLDSKKKKPA